MTKGTRRALFYTAVVVFLAVSYTAILYAQGYKYSFTDKKFFRTGAISLRANNDAKVFLDDNLTGNTSFLTNSFSVSGLLPGQYTIRLQRENYSPWQKTATVQEGFVIDFPRVLILPLDEDSLDKIASEAVEVFTTHPAVTPTPIAIPAPKKSPILKPSPTSSQSLTPIAEPEEPFSLKNKTLTWTIDGQSQDIGTNVVGYAVSDSKKKIAWWTSNNEVYVMWLADTDYQLEKHRGDRELVIRFSASVLNLAWFRGEDHLIAAFKSGYRVVEIDTRGGVNVIKI